MQLFLISNQRIGLNQVVEAFAAKQLPMRDKMAEYAGPGMDRFLRFETELLRLTLGHKRVDEVLPQAAVDIQRCQAHFYAGARSLTTGDREEARREFDACLAVNCDTPERQLAQAEKASMNAG
jgi:hypothetical protein